VESWAVSMPEAALRHGVTEQHLLSLMMIGFTTHLSPTRHLADVTPATAAPKVAAWVP
jgi:hypothetical protein